LAAGAADAGAGEGRLDVIVAVVEAREGILDWSCDLQWAGAELALLVVHGFVGAAFGVVVVCVQSGELFYKTASRDMNSHRKGCDVSLAARHLLFINRNRRLSIRGLH
jgi:hypothetical protein